MYTTTVSQTTHSGRESGSTHQLSSNFTLAWTPFWAPGFGVLSYWKLSTQAIREVDTDLFVMPVDKSTRIYCTAILRKDQTENSWSRSCFFFNRFYINNHCNHETFNWRSRTSHDCILPPSKKSLQLSSCYANRPVLASGLSAWPPMWRGPRP